MFKEKVVSLTKRAYGVAKSCLLATVVTVGSVIAAAQAHAQVTLPDLGVDVAATATAIGTGLGTIVASTITIFGAFLVIVLGLRWIKRTIK